MYKRGRSNSYNTKGKVAKCPNVSKHNSWKNHISIFDSSLKAINFVLMVERIKKKLLIYFINRSLQASKLNYPNLEKLTLAIVYATRWL